MTAAAIDLCTLADVKSYLGIDPSNTDSDATLQMLITAASQFASTYCSRIFQETTYTNEIYDGPGGRVLVLKQSPIVAVTALTIGPQTIQLSSAPNKWGYTFSDVAIYLRGGYIFCMDYQNVSVTYEAGYATIPADLSEAVVELVVLKFRNQPNIGTISRTIAGESKTFGIQDMDAYTKSVFNLYQRASY